MTVIKLSDLFLFAEIVAAIGLVAYVLWPIIEFIR